ncbi:MAG: class I SAM-dependent methyltransferase [Terriglobales bacterium]
METISFAVSQPLCRDFELLVQQRIVSRNAHRIADLGGGANPMLSASFCRRYDLDYSVVDISEEELAKAPAGVRRVHVDLGSRDFTWQGERYDLVFSRMVAEHMPDGRQFHRNVLELVAPGGLALHCFPTLYSLPFLVNRVVSQRFSSWLLKRVQPRDRYRHAKFPAHYSWCRGPSRRQCRRFTSLGYDVVEYQGYFGHPYFEAVPWLDACERRVAAWLALHPLPLGTSYAYLTLAKPARQAATAVAPAWHGHLFPEARWLG